LGYSGIKKDVAVIGMINKIELWDPNIISKIDATEADLDDNSFDDLANEINF
jgi:MraZ protein